MSGSAAETLRVLGLWLHLLAVVTWVGSTIGWMLVLLTVGTRRRPDGVQWLERLGRRVYTIGWEASFVIVLTGIFNLLPRIQSGRVAEPGYYTALLIKLGLLGGMVGLQLWQHGWLVSKLGEGATAPGFSSQPRTSILVASGLLVALAAGALWIGTSLRF